MPLLGEMLVQQKLVSQDVIDQAIRIQVKGDYRRLGQILVKMRAITADQLAETLSERLNIAICNIADIFSGNARSAIPRHLCLKYGVLPLSLKKDNILEMAIADPADYVAIQDLEHYTGKAIEARLARLSDIYREIPRRIPLTVRDIFSPRSNTWLTRVTMTVCLVLVILAGALTDQYNFTHQYINEAKYGTISTTTNATVYKNQDLMLTAYNDGKVNLSGHAAYASSSYSVSFKDLKELRSFLDSRKADLSEKQRSWLDGVITTEIPRYTRRQ